tara:strand:+ start:1166 stop:2599 length:1434 start_codon:yes stop_codon:yes gene_type:complete
MRKDVVIPVILCGGSGSRLWPLSRESYPKQYLSLIKDSKSSLLQKTIKRINKVKNIIPPIIICNEEHRFIVLNQLRQINVEPIAIILEPVGRNTAPAIAISALQAIKKYHNPKLLVLAADHEIKNKDGFINTIENGIHYSNLDFLVTFGIVPTRPETGYGYIEVKEYIPSNTSKGYPIKKFVEKPNLETAKRFIEEKRFLWNSGMFLFKAETILNEINKYNPNLRKTCSESLDNAKKDLVFTRLEESSFKKANNISIDTAVMEKTKSSIVMPLNVGWSDIGSWKSIWEIEDKDPKQNVSIGKVFLKNSRNCYVRSDSRLIVGIGLDDLIIVETRDAILITKNNSDQEVKNVLNELKENSYVESKTHKKIYRPWGNYLSLAESDNWQVKRIEVNVNGSLSLQLHMKRSEHWVVVKGSALVEIDERRFILEENQSTYIPLGSKHRLSNNGDQTLILIEVQSGIYLGEDDIIRFKDIYGR